MQYLKVEEHGTVKALFMSSSVWFVLGTMMGLTSAIQLSAPDLLANIPYVVFSRLRPMHTTTVIFGFAGAGLLGAAHYMVASLLRTPLYSERLGKLSVWIYNIAILVGDVALSLGHSQSREYAEWIWPADVGILLALGLMFVNFLMTAIRRKEPVLYVSVWYAFAGLIFTWFIYFFGNAMWNPSTGAIAGLPDAILAWFYGHGIVGLYLTPLAVAVAYYVVPLVTRSPLYSHTLSLVGFWTILMIYTHIGAHHLLQTPIPTWVKVLAVSGSLAMIIPVMTVLVNLWLTMRGRLGLIHQNVGGRFVMASLVWYILTCIQGPLQALPAVQRITHLNNWVIAHSHMGVLGFAGIMALGGIYFILPRVTGRPIHNERLADVQYWLVLIGMAGFFLVLTAAGLVQGHAWLSGETVYRTVPMLHPYFLVRLGLGVFIFTGAVLGLYNVAMSLYRPKPEGGDAS